MATAHYATGGIGPLWSYIPWADFTGLSLSAGQSINYTCTFPGIGILNMNIYAPSGGWVSTTAGGWPFATTIYTGVAGRAGVLSLGSGSIIFRNISLTDFNNQPLNKNYYVIVTDSEGTGTQNGGERLTWVTNGAPWINLGTVPNVTGTQSVITGVSTDTLVSNGSLGTGATFITPVGVTLNPTNIELDVIAYSNQGTTFGIEVETLNLNKSVSAAYAKTNDILTYTVAFANVSLFNTLANATFVDTLPNGTSYVADSLKVNGSTYTSATFPSLLTLPDMGAQQVATISYQVSVLDSASVSLPNYAYASGIQGPSFNSGVSNVVSTSILKASLSLQKLVDKTYAAPNSTITYTLVVKNLGNTQATGVTIIDTLPSTTTYVAGSLTGGTGSPPTINLTNIQPLGTTTVTFIALVSSLPNATLNNTAYTNYSYLYNLVNSTAGSTISNTVSTNTSKANIQSLNKTVDKTYAILNDTLTYSFNFTNIGNTSAISMTFVDTLSNSVQFIPNSLYINGVNYPGSYGNPISLTIPNLASLATSTILFSVLVTTLPAGNTVTNTGSLNYSDAFATIPNILNSNVVTTTISSAILGSSKYVNKSYAQIADVLTYTIPVQNTGNANAINAYLIDTLPLGLTLVTNSIKVNGVSTSGSLNSPGVLLGTIPSNSITTVTFNVLVESVPNSNPFLNEGLVQYGYVVNPASVPMTGSVYTNIVPTSIVKNSVTVTKLVDKAYGYPGEIIDYTVVVQNLGNIVASNLVFVDTISSSLMFINNSLNINGVPTAYTPNSVPLGNLNPSTQITITFQAMIK